jgi:catechol 2,3-dioxygenase-like lactoylglutathione lyase family enzyme
MDILGFDHIVISSTDVDAILKFYQSVLGMAAEEERPNKWALHFGTSKISIQDASSLPDIARQTAPGTANFCVYTDTPMDDVVAKLNSHSTDIVAGPGERLGANGTILSVYFNDPDGNLVEVCNRLDR